MSQQPRCAARVTVALLCALAAVLCVLGLGAVSASPASSGTPASGTPAAGTPAAGTPAAGTPAAGAGMSVMAAMQAPGVSGYPVAGGGSQAVAFSPATPDPMRCPHGGIGQASRCAGVPAGPALAHPDTAAAVSGWPALRPAPVAVAAITAPSWAVWFGPPGHVGDVLRV